MLYQLSNDKKKLSPLAFLDFGHLKALEKDLENLLAEHLLTVLFEDASLMPIFQERKRQSEADIYALDKTILLKKNATI